MNLPLKLTVPIVALATLFVPLALSAQSAPPEMPPKLDSAIADGLAFLARQQRYDGSFEATGPRVALTGLAAIAFLSAGHVSDDGVHGATVRRAVDFLLSQAPADGYYGAVDGSRMYGHCIVMVALAEAMGVERDPRLRQRMRQLLVQGAGVIRYAQTIKKDPVHAGGWRYEPNSADSDLSLSGWCALALRATQNLGIYVPREHIDGAIHYVMLCNDRASGGFVYQPGGQPYAAMTGVALLNLYLMGAADRPETAAALKYLVANPPSLKATGKPYYAMYYAAQAAFHAGGETWSAIWPSVSQDLLRAQEPDGGWPPSPTPEEPGRIYSTSMAVLTLTVPYRLLPVYQR